MCLKFGISDLQIAHSGGTAETGIVVKARRQMLLARGGGEKRALCLPPGGDLPLHIFSGPFFVVQLRLSLGKMVTIIIATVDTCQMLYLQGF